MIEIIIPAYNAELTIERCIESILSQDYKDYKITVINDGSTDKTAEICSKYKEVNVINQLHRGVYNSGYTNGEMNMNTIEYEMIDILNRLKNEYGVFEIKAEFEAEGSRMEEMMRLKDITSAIGLPIILKIGGVEAVTDIYNALSIGAKGIVAPMVETPFALSKYVNMVKSMIAEDNARDIQFAFNIETITAVSYLAKMLSTDISPIESITIGRVDLSASLGIGRQGINSPEMLDICQRALSIIKGKGLKTALGGAISYEALDFLINLEDLIDKFETRKVVFPISACRLGKEAIICANQFELLWLKSKRRYYSRIKDEDEKRIIMLEERIK